MKGKWPKKNQKQKQDLQVAYRLLNSYINVQDISANRQGALSLSNQWKIGQYCKFNLMRKSDLIY